MEKVFELQKKDFNGLCYINLVDFDMIYGHRRDILGYTTALNEFDKDLEIFLANMRGDDVLFISADHGCDPGYKELIIRVSLYRFWVTVNAGNRA